jgi:hypothetical protein
MPWRIMVGASEEPWRDPIPLEPDTGWAEAWDEIIPGYRTARFASEAEASAIANSLRAHGLSAATELAPEGSDPP